MKIQLDTELKTISIENDVNLKKLIEMLDKLLPKKEWEGYSLKTNITINNWSSPYIIERPKQPYYFENPWIIYNGTTGNIDKNKDYCVQSGIFNVEIN